MSWKKILFVVLVFLVSLYSLRHPSSTNALGCTFTGGDVSVSVGQTVSANVSVTNSGPGSAILVQVANPDDQAFFQLTGGEASGWSASVAGGNVTFTGGSLAASQQGTFTVQIQGVSPTVDFPAGFTLYISADGSLMDECSGGVQVNVSETGASAATSAPASTSAPATTTTTTTTTTTSTTAAVVVLKDTISPRVSIETDFEKPFEVSPVVSGKATDAGAINAGINKVEYSVDGGANWLPVDDVSGLGGKSVTFEFDPGIPEDGNYSIVVRATDFSGNRGLSGEKILVIDRLPPLVGGNLMSLGPLLLLPDINGIVYTMAGVDNKITMSAVGGPTSIDLTDGTNTYSLPKSVQSGLWSGIMNFKLPGFYKISAKSIDGAGNITERELNSVLVIDSGKVIEKSGGGVKGAEVSIYQQDEVSKIWNLWDAESFGQVSRQVTGEDGSYSYFLPPGTYYAKVKASGYRNLTSKVFKIETPTPFNSIFELKKGLSFPFFDFNFESSPVSIIAPKSPDADAASSLTGKEAPVFALSGTSADFELQAMRGRPSILTFVSTWLPTTSEQISAIKNLDDEKEKRVAVVSLQENLSKTKLFVQKGGYNLNIAADPDGELIQTYFINSLPTHYFLDRQGIIRKKMVGVLSAEELKQNLDSI